MIYNIFLFQVERNGQEILLKKPLNKGKQKIRILK